MKKFPIKKINLKKVDVHNDFRDFKQIFSTPEDIEDFIEFKKLELPVLKEFLRLRRSKVELDLTQTEIEVYFNNLFDYIYDVFRIPVEYTYIETAKRLEYIETRLVLSGLQGVIEDYYNWVLDMWRMKINYIRFLKEAGKERLSPVINYHTDIGESSNYYNSNNPDLIESFWIKSSRHAGQPVVINDEAYMRVHVYPEKVYIFGCDDCSYTYFAENKKDCEEFVALLKSASPVWHFGYTQRFGKKFEFTN